MNSHRPDQPPSILNRDVKHLLPVEIRRKSDPRVDDYESSYESPSSSLIDSRISNESSNSLHEEDLA